MRQEEKPPPERAEVKEVCLCGREVYGHGDQHGFVFACVCGRRWRKH